MNSSFRSLQILVILLLAPICGCKAPARNASSQAAAEASRNARPQAANAAATRDENAEAETVSPPATPQPASDADAGSAPVLVGDHPDKPGAAAQKPPKILVPTRKVDFGRQSANATVVRSVLVRNGGSGDLTLDSVEPSCGCTTVDFP